MGLSTLALALGALLLATGFAIWLYRAREVPVGRTGFLIAARAGAIALVLLLLLNPRIPGGAPGGTPTSWVLVDRSVSMAAGAEGGDTPWDRALDEVGTAPVVLFGGTPERVPAQGTNPTAATSRLTDGLRLAIEAGAREVRVVSDFRLSDLSSSFDLLERSGVGIDLEPVGGLLRNAGVDRFEIGTGGGASATVEVFAEGSEGDSANIAVFLDDQRLTSTPVRLPAAGSVERVSIPLGSVPADGQVRRYRAVVEHSGDVFPDDDERVAYVRSGIDDGGVVLVSTQPDWEPRFLLPTLRDVTGFEGEGYLAAQGGRFLRAFADDGSVSSVDSADVRRRALRAELVVLHSTAGLDDWTRSWLDRLNRVVVLASDTETLAQLGLASVGGRVGEWYADEQPPVSPVAGGLAGVSFEDLPPLGSLVVVDYAPGWSAAMTASFERQGSPAAALLLNGTGRRVAVAPTNGWWRWAFREGPPREAYRRVWSAVAGWMMAGESQRLGDRVEPDEPVVGRGMPVRWNAPGLVGDTVHVQIGPTGAFLVDTLVAIDSTETFVTPVLDPGVYAYMTSTDAESSEGRFDVERYVPELRLQVADLDRAAASAPALAVRVSGGRRLRTASLPYLLLIGILAAEWLMRRQKGLR